MADATPGCYEAYSAKLRAFLASRLGKPRLRKQREFGGWLCLDHLPTGGYRPFTVGATPLEAYERWVKRKGAERAAT